MENRLELFLDNQPITLASGTFPDGAVWVKVTDALPRTAQQMRIRAAAMRDMNDFMCLAQLVDAVRQVTDVTISHLELPWLPYARQDRHMVAGDSFALKVFASTPSISAKFLSSTRTATPRRQRSITLS